MMANAILHLTLEMLLIKCAVITLLNISAILLKYPNFEGVFSFFLWTNNFFFVHPPETYTVLQTIQMKLMFSCVWAEPAILGSTRAALKFKYEIQIG